MEKSQWPPMWPWNTGQRYSNYIIWKSQIFSPFTLRLAVFDIICNFSFLIGHDINFNVHCKILTPSVCRQARLVWKYWKKMCAKWPINDLEVSKLKGSHIHVQEACRRTKLPLISLYDTLFSARIPLIGYTFKKLYMLNLKVYQLS